MNIQGEVTLEPINATYDEFGNYTLDEYGNYTMDNGRLIWQRKRALHCLKTYLIFFYIFARTPKEGGVGVLYPLSKHLFRDNYGG